MSVRSYESAVVAEARGILKNSKLRLKDIMEWRTSVIEPEDGEVVIFCSGTGAYAAFKKEVDKRSTT